MNVVTFSEYTQRFIDFLAHAAPDLHAVVRPAVDWEEKPTGFALIEVVSPNENASAPLWISTEEDEVTVGFDAFHEHFETWEYSSEEESFRSALSRARDVVAERVFVASWWLGEKWSGSQFIEPGTKPERSERVSGDSRLRIRSWTGRCDYEEKG